MGGGETENGNGRISAPRGNKLAELPLVYDESKFRLFFLSPSPSFPLFLPRRRCYSIFSADFDIGWNKVKLSVGFFWKRRRDELGDSKVKSGINEMNFLLHYIFIKKRNRELTG